MTRTPEQRARAYASAKRSLQARRIRIGATVKCPQCDFIGFSLSGHRKVHQ